MKINFSKVFGKQYKKLYLKDQKKVDKIINTFIKNPFDKSLNNHHLK
jgi:mRNA-degrading endonuclease YafQ of YafQ-DinJ toxin-antitoxin module